MSFCDDLVKYDNKGKLNFLPVVENPPNEKWVYGTGRINAEMIENYMPSPRGS